MNTEVENGDAASGPRNGLLYDSKCYDLACHFLHSGAEESEKVALARDIQQAVEDYFAATEPEDEVTKLSSIDELQRLLEKEDDVPIQIMPNGEIRAGGTHTDKKPLTMRENLGGEYGNATAK